MKDVAFVDDDDDISYIYIHTYTYARIHKYIYVCMRKKQMHRIDLQAKKQREKKMNYALILCIM